MAIASLKAELQQISKAFPKSHTTFRVINASIDEICCHFVTRDGKHEINCTISVSSVSFNNAVFLFYLSPIYIRCCTCWAFNINQQISTTCVFSFPVYLYQKKNCI